MHLFDGLFEPLFEIAAVFRAREHAGKIERVHDLVAQKIGHVAVNDRLRKPLYDRALAHARFADQHGIVFGAAG